MNISVAFVSLKQNISICLQKTYGFAKGSKCRKGMTYEEESPASKVDGEFFGTYPSRHNGREGVHCCSDGDAD